MHNSGLATTELTNMYGAQAMAIHFQPNATEFIVPFLKPLH